MKFEHFWTILVLLIIIIRIKLNYTEEFKKEIFFTPDYSSFFWKQENESFTNQSIYYSEFFSLLDYTCENMQHNNNLNVTLKNIKKLYANNDCHNPNKNVFIDKLDTTIFMECKLEKTKRTFEFINEYQNFMNKHKNKKLNTDTFFIAENIHDSRI